MKVLAITGDKRFGPGHPRYELQKAAVDELAVVYWGRGSVWPSLLHGAYDVVTVQDPFVRGLFGWYAAKKLHARFNVQVHTDLAARGVLHRLLARLVLAQADTVRVVTEKIKKQINHPRVAVLPVYVDVQQFASVVRRPHEQKNILWIGRFEDEKDPLRAVEILAEVRRAGVAAQLVMLGDGSLKQKLHEHAKKLPIELLGWQDVRPYLAEADVVLCTSRHESFGASIVEALAAGVPVVAPDIGVAKEAGAVVVSRQHMTGVVAEALRSGATGELKLKLLSAEEWSRAWRESL